MPANRPDRFIKAAATDADAQIGWAKRVLASGDGAVSVDGIMVDEPVRLRTRAILAAVLDTAS